MSALRLGTISLITAAGLVTSVANASVVTFTNFDQVNSTDPHPNSDAAAASFDAAAGALGTLSLINFSRRL